MATIDIEEEDVSSCYPYHDDSACDSVPYGDRPHVPSGIRELLATLNLVSSPNNKRGRAESC